MHDVMKTPSILALALLLAGAVSIHAADAKETYARLCAKCHGEDGKGQTKMGRKLDIKDFGDSAAQAAFTDDQAFKAIKEGIKDKNGTTRMKAVEGVSDDDIKALVHYVRSFKK